MLKRLIPFLAALTLVGVASAQTKLDPFDAHCADIVALQVKPVQKELGVTEATRKQLNVHAAWHQEQLKALDAEIQKKKLDPNSPQVQTKVGDLFGVLKTKILSVLTPAQVKRLGQISLQRVGDAALTDPVVARKVGLTDAQLKKLQATFREGAEKFSALERATAQKVLLPYKDRKPKSEAEAKRMQDEVRSKMAAAGKQVKPKLDAIRADYAKRIKAILTSSQSKTFAALRGKPFRGS